MASGPDNMFKWVKKIMLRELRRLMGELGKILDAAGQAVGDEANRAYDRGKKFAASAIGQDLYKQISNPSKTISNTAKSISKKMGW